MDDWRGQGQVEPEDLYGHGDCHPDRDLPGASPRSGPQPAPRLYRTRGGSGEAGRSVAVYAVGPDRPGDAISGLRALSCTHSVEVNYAKQARSPVGGNAVLGSAAHALISSNPVTE